MSLTHLSNLSLSKPELLSEGAIIFLEKTFDLFFTLEGLLKIADPLDQSQLMLLLWLMLSP